METAVKFLHEMQFGKLEKPVKAHLKNVYACMGVALFSAALGSYVHLFTNLMGAGLLTSIGSFATLIALLSIQPKSDNLIFRLSLLNFFAFLSGISLGPLLHMVILINPSIIATALLGSAFIFLCFSISALLSEDRKFLALGGILFSGLTGLLVLGLLNIFIGSELLFQVHLYIGLAIMCGFILYDTQLIVEKFKMGDDDYVRHCLDLFMDFINIFRYILILLSDKENNRRRRRNSSN